MWLCYINIGCATISTVCGQNLCCFFVQDQLSLSSDIDVTSCDHHSSVFDDACDVDVLNVSTPDNSTDDTSRQTEGVQMKRTVRSKRRKQLLTERPAAAEFSEVCD